MHRNVLKTLLLVLGCVATALGFIGIFVPGLPTTIFLIIAAWAFANSSTRFHAWLMGHRHFGPLIQNWQQHRVVPVRAKVTMVIVMCISVATLGFMFTQTPWVPGLVAVILILVATYVLRCPSSPLRSGRVKKQAAK